MEVAGRHVVVTGGAGGIGRALIRRFAQEGARAIVAADRDLAGAQTVAAEAGALAVELDAGRESSVLALVAEATAAHGPIDIFISNAGVPGAMGGPEAPDDVWDEAWRVNVMAHVWAARALLPEMLERGDGYLINTASAAGLLTQVSSLVYSVTKHAAVSLAEWMAIEYGERGVRVSCICPQGVRTPMLDLAMDDPAGAAALTSGGLIEPEDVADAVVAGIRDERMLILPHENVAGFMALKGSDPERWLKGMRRMVRTARS
ncbi:MAG: short-chain dehydrogenase [Solirubrobacterales bacterium]|jgi:NAD(P)-dependent dehydrogenase (short-subunit alcohol dehydrogenase family)|nr:short-chain dehydrogenase [Solirubrobacterales bacterium]MCW3025147.1 short-chain dehydrogenase [Solirubrobacterales bacterium]